ncbi:MAG TPA: response regulator [Anaeromyxobacteraceae bacterium]|nr:response regulator [Anaeromyxobacteraceae bacterium]
MKVLIADDDQTIRALLRDMLADMGHVVVAATNGAEAVDLASSEHPDAVILDFLMPKLSGLDALKAMRERGLLMPAVLLTAISDSSMRELEGFEAPEAILEKPFKRRTIEKALARATRTG